jgi:hypothetical protein
MEAMHNSMHCNRNFPIRFRIRILAGTNNLVRASSQIIGRGSIRARIPLIQTLVVGTGAIFKVLARAEISIISRTSITIAAIG